MYSPSGRSHTGNPESSNRDSLGQENSDKEIGLAASNKGAVHNTHENNMN